MNRTTVFIVGAGPTGLVLACELAWRGVAVRIVDAKPGPSRHSKALAVLPRTLELLENHGVVDEMVRRGRPLRHVNVHGSGRRIARIDTALIDGAHDYFLSLPQSETERILLDRLRVLGVEVEWRTEVVSVDPTGDSVRVRVRRADEAETVAAPWLAGCDGAHSFVRHALGLPFAGERYRDAFDLADVGIRWSLPDDEVSVFLSEHGTLAAVPLPERGRFRLIVNELPESADEDRADPTPDDLRRWLAERADARITGPVRLRDPSWSSRFRIHRRMVPRMRHGRIVLAGDAAHVHSPAGGQGMNSGIQDAVNLGWKLARVIREGAPETLLDSYDAERCPVARAVLRGTHRLTRVATVRTPVLLALRARTARLLLGREAVRRRLLALGSGLVVNYRDSPIVAGAGWGLGGVIPRSIAPRAAPVPGDRAPDALGRRAGHPARLYDALRHPGHTLLLFAETTDDLRRAERTRVAVEDLPGAAVRTVVIVGGETAAAVSDDGTVLHDPGGALRARYKAGRWPVHLVRPDRYVAFRGRDLDAGPILRFWRDRYGRDGSHGTNTTSNG